MTKRPLFTFGQEPSHAEDFDPLLGRSVSVDELASLSEAEEAATSPAGAPTTTGRGPDPYDDWFNIKINNPVAPSGPAAPDAIEPQALAPSAAPPVWTPFKVRGADEAADTDSTDTDTTSEVVTEALAEPGETIEVAADSEVDTAPEPSVEADHRPVTESVVSEDVVVEEPATEPSTIAPEADLPEPDLTEADVQETKLPEPVTPEPAMRGWDDLDDDAPAQEPILEAQPEAAPEPVTLPEPIAEEQSLSEPEPQPVVAATIEPETEIAPEPLVVEQAASDPEPSAQPEPEDEPAAVFPAKPKPLSSDWDKPLFSKLRTDQPLPWENTPILGKAASQSAKPERGLFGLKAIPAEAWDTPPRRPPTPQATDPWDVVTGKTAEPRLAPAATPATPVVTEAAPDALEPVVNDAPPPEAIPEAVLETPEELLAERFAPEALEAAPEASGEQSAGEAPPVDPAGEQTIAETSCDAAPTVEDVPATADVRAAEPMGEASDSEASDSIEPDVEAFDPAVVARPETEGFDGPDAEVKESDLDQTDVTGVQPVAVTAQGFEDDAVSEATPEPESGREPVATSSVIAPEEAQSFDDDRDDPVANAFGRLRAVLGEPATSDASEIDPSAQPAETIEPINQAPSEAEPSIDASPIEPEAAPIVAAALNPLTPKRESFTDSEDLQAAPNAKQSASQPAADPFAPAQVQRPKSADQRAAEGQNKKRAAASAGRKPGQKPGRKPKKVRQPTPAWVSFTGTLLFGFALILIAASYAAPLNPVLQEIAVFFWYWAGLAVASAAVWIAGKRYAMAIASAILAAIALQVLVPSAGVAPQGTGKAHMIGWVNLQKSERALEEVLEDARANGADLMILAELPDSFNAPPHGWSMIEQPIPGNPLGLAVLSKGNWRATTLKDEPTMARPVDNSVTVIAINASGTSDVEGRQAEINRAAARAGDQDTPVLAVGDFGEPAWTRQMVQFAEYSGGQRIRCGGFLGATYSGLGGFFGWSADHAFMVNGQASACKIGKRLPGTRHKPLWITIPPATTRVVPQSL